MHWVPVRVLRAQRETHMLRKTFALAMVAGTLLIAGCNTVSGAGKDLQSASQEVKEEIK
jgi:predicted small secreted protein